MASWKDNVRAVTPYTPGEQPKTFGIIKLNTNENPYPPSDAVMRVIKDYDGALLRKYPDPACAVLVNALSEYHGVDKSNIFVGVGSDDVIAMAFLTYFCSDKPVLFPDVTYSFYEVWADMMRIPYEKKPLDEQFKIKAEDYTGIQNGGIIFPNPNAPTGLETELSDVEGIVKANPNSVVIIDEAYVDFGAASAIELTAEYENLLVTRTFSKSRSMAGLRIGYAIGSSELIKCLWDVRNSYNSYTMSNLTLQAGAASLKDDTYFKETLQRIIKTREAAKQSFKALGFEVLDSKANFLFVKHADIPAKMLFDELYEKKIFVRYFSGERTRDYLRVTIGTDDEMEALFKFLENRLSQDYASGSCMRA